MAEPRIQYAKTSNGVNIAYWTLGEGNPSVVASWDFRGEHVAAASGGYHYYPGREQVVRWLDAEGLGVAEEGYSRGKGYGYRHLLLRSRDD